MNAASPQYVYVISNYDEHGLEPPIVATTERERIEGLISEHWPGCDEELAELKKLLERPGAELACQIAEPPSWWKQPGNFGSNVGPYWTRGQYHLTKGCWGALQLLVVKLVGERT